MIYVLLEKVVRYAQMPVDCLRALKLVTLGYVLDDPKHRVNILVVEWSILRCNIT